MAFGSFSGGRSSVPPAEINMVPLIDVMLVLLVIFMVTAPLLTHSVRLQLPEVSASPQSPEERAIEVSIDAQGGLFLGRESISREALQAHFAQVSTSASGSVGAMGSQPMTAAQRAAAMPQTGAAQGLPPVHIRADAAARYEVIAQVLADASSAGFSRIAFITAPESASTVEARTELPAL